MTLPLHGIRVLDLSRMFAAPWCTQTLGDLGADVIKVERPGTGDDLRAYGPPFIETAKGDRLSPYFLSANRNKRSITIDLASEEGARLVRELAAGCDVMIENFKVGDLARYGLDFASVNEVAPQLIYCSVTGFGQTGPYASRPGLDSVFQAMSGLMSITGQPDGPPQKNGMLVSDFTAGMFATVAILAALRDRDMGGSGQQIDISLLDCQVAALSNRAQHYLVTGEAPERQGSESPGNQPTGLFPCADGDLMISAGSEPRFRSFMHAIGRDDLAEDLRFTTRANRIAHRADLAREIAIALRAKNRSEWLPALQRAGVMAAPINDIGEAFADPQVQHRGMVQTAHLADGTTIPLISSPMRFSANPVAPFRAPPLLGEDTDAVLAERLGLSADRLADLRERGVI